MPAQKRASTSAQSFELLEAFPCPAWIEDSLGRILARNAHPRPAHGHPSVKTSARPLLLAASTKELRLVALFPASRKTAWRHRILSALLARMLHFEQTGDGCPLTPRERDIHREFSRGHSYKTIAANLGITHETVRWHIARIRQKLGPESIPILRRKNAGRSQPKPT